MLVNVLSVRLERLPLIRKIEHLKLHYPFGRKSRFVTATLRVMLHIVDGGFSTKERDLIINLLRKVVPNLRIELVRIYDLDGLELSAVSEDGTIPRPWSSVYSSPDTTAQNSSS